MRKYQSLERELEAELQSLLHWWVARMTDETYGGYYGRIDGENVLHPMAHKGSILNSRLLWTFAAIANATQDPIAIQHAHRSANYWQQHFWDEQEGGVYWMLDYLGELVEGRKQIYAQAFGIYALAEYYVLSKQSWALEKAMELFWLIERYSSDPQRGGYYEAFSQSWGPLEDLRLSEKDANEAKTMNTHLHVLEAYTHLYRVSEDENVKIALEQLIACFLEHFVDPNSGHLHLFFNEVWEGKSSAISFGHDIECSWLLWEAAEVLGNPALMETLRPIVIQQVDTTLGEGQASSGALWNEQAGSGHVDTDHHWWPQAEAMVGCWNAWELTGNTKYVAETIRIWTFIKEYLKDGEGGEWHWRVNEAGEVAREEDKAGPWKAPYHNGRMCLEVLRRMGEH